MRRSPGRRASSSTTGAILLSATGNLFPPLAVLATAPVLARELGVAGRGDLAAILAPTLLALAICTIGLPEAVTRIVASRKMTRKVLFRALSLLALTGAIATVGIATFADFLGGDSPLVPRLASLASFTVFPGLTVALLRGVAAGSGHWGRVAVERFFNGLFRALPILLLAATGSLNLFAATAAFALGPVAASIAYIGMSIPAKHQHTDDLRDETTYRGLLSFGLRVWAGSVAGILLLRVDQLVMALISSPFQLGIYAVAANVSEVPQIANSAFREVLFAKDSERNDDVRLLIAARCSLILSSATGVLVITTGVFWLQPLFGADFGPALSVAAVLGLGIVLGTPGSVAGAGLSARGNPGRRSISMGVAAVISIALLLLLTPGYGAMGAAWSSLAGSLVASNGNIIFMWRLHGIPPWGFYTVRFSDLTFMRKKSLGLFNRGAALS